MKYLEQEGFSISDDPQLTSKYFTDSPIINDEIDLIYNDILDDVLDVKSRIKELIADYPDNPNVKQLMFIYHIFNEEFDHAFDCNTKILTEHPDYFYAMANQANAYIDYGDLDEVVNLLGEDFNLKHCYPSRDIFHINEIMSIYKVAVRYHAAMLDFDTAEDYVERMMSIDEDHPEVENAQEMLMFETLNQQDEFLQSEKDYKFTVEIPSQDLTLKRTSPKFQHAEISLLYDYELDIDDGILYGILALPRKSLVSDLCLVLKDSVERFSFFKKKSKYETAFVFHAISLLAELEATEVLPEVLNVFKQSEDYFEKYFLHYQHDDLWHSIYKLGQNQLDLLEEFMKTSGVIMNYKVEVTSALVQIAIHQPERREEVIEFFASVLSFYANAKPEDNVIDSLLLGDTIEQLKEINANELLFVINNLIEKDYVYIKLCGDVSAIQNDMKAFDSNDFKKELLSISDYYIHNTTTRYNPINDILDFDDDPFDLEDEFDIDFDDEAEEDPFKKTSFNDLLEDLLSEESESSKVQPYKTEKKVGRNESCPCGSGKKYKKCCLGK